MDFKFLEPYNFEFKHSMRMWDKKEMLGNYRVQLNVAGYEFYGQAELPQQAKHNAAVQALPIVRNLPDPTGTAAVVAKPGKRSSSLPERTKKYKLKYFSWCCRRRRSRGTGRDDRQLRNWTDLREEHQHGSQRDRHAERLRPRVDPRLRSRTSAPEGQSDNVHL